MYKSPGIQQDTRGRVSKNPQTVKMQNIPKGISKSLPLGGRWQKSLIFDG